jgi:hypothetical protein
MTTLVNEKLKIRLQKVIYEQTMQKVKQRLLYHTQLTPLTPPWLYVEYRMCACIVARVGSDLRSARRDKRISNGIDYVPKFI